MEEGANRIPSKNCGQEDPTTSDPREESSQAKAKKREELSERKE